MAGFLFVSVAPVSGRHNPNARSTSRLAMRDTLSETAIAHGTAIGTGKSFTIK
jgi:hypothetical protein